MQRAEFPDTETIEIAPDRIVSGQLLGCDGFDDLHLSGRTAKMDELLRIHPIIARLVLRDVLQIFGWIPTADNIAPLGSSA